MGTMSKITTIGRIFIIVVNILFAIIAVCCIVLGFILRFAQDYLKTYIDQVLAEIEDCVHNYYGDTTFSVDDFDITVMLKDIGVVIIIIGVILLALCMLAFVGACCSVKVILIVYAVVVGAILVTQIVMSVLLFEYPDVLKDAIKPTLQSYLDEYEGIKGSGYTLGMNVLMQSYKCCGVDGEQDFKKSKDKWKKNDKDGDKVVTPVACCKTLPKDDTKKDKCAGNTDVSTEVTDLTDSNYNKGCIDAVFEELDQKVFIYFKIAVAFCCVLQFALIVFSILIYIKKKNKGLV